MHAFPRLDFPRYAPGTNPDSTPAWRRAGRIFCSLAALASLSGLCACGDDDGGDGAAVQADAASKADAANQADATGQADAATSVDAAGQAVSDCAGGGFLFCEDFEALAAGPATSPQWTIAQSEGSSAVVEATPNAGTIARPLGSQALHLRIVPGGGGGGFSFLQPNDEPAAPDNSFFGRVWVWLNDKPLAPNFAHFTMVEGVGQVGAATVFVRPLGGQFIQPVAPTDPPVMYGVGSDGGESGDWTDWDPSAPTEEMKWTCLEWQIDTSDNIIRVFIDGDEKEALTVSTNVHSRRGSGNPDADFVIPAVFGQFKVGWQLYQGGSDLAVQDLWYDGIALSTTRIGCGD